MLRSRSHGIRALPRPSQGGNRLHRGRAFLGTEQVGRPGEDRPSRRPQAGPFSSFRRLDRGACSRGGRGSDSRPGAGSRRRQVCRTRGATPVEQVPPAERATLGRPGLDQEALGLDSQADVCLSGPTARLGGLREDRGRLGGTRGAAHEEHGRVGPRDHLGTLGSGPASLPRRGHGQRRDDRRGSRRPEAIPDAATIHVVRRLGALGGQHGQAASAGGDYPLRQQPLAEDRGRGRLALPACIGLSGIFSIDPNGGTDLTKKLNQIYNDKKDLLVGNKQLLIIVITDGEPVDGTSNPRNNLYRAITNITNNGNVHVSFAECTDQEEDMKYLDEWDNKIKNFDNTDDYREELRRVKATNGQSFKFDYTDYVIKILLATFIKSYFNIDQGSNNIQRSDNRQNNDDCNCCTIL